MRFAFNFMEIPHLGYKVWCQWTLFQWICYFCSRSNTCQPEPCRTLQTLKVSFMGLDSGLLPGCFRDAVNWWMLCFLWNDQCGVWARFLLVRILLMWVLLIRTLLDCAFFEATLMYWSFIIILRFIYICVYLYFYHSYGNMGVGKMFENPAKIVFYPASLPFFKNGPASD